MRPGAGCSHGWRKGKALQVDDVRDDLGAQPVARKHPLQEHRWRHPQRGRGEVALDVHRRGAEEVIGLPAPVVDDRRHAAPGGDAQGGRRTQMPGPARVGEHVHHLHPPAGPPQRQQVRQQPDQRPQHRHAPGPGRPIRRVGPHQLDPCTFGLQQPHQLLALVGHATGRRWQRADDADLRPGVGRQRGRRGRRRGTRSPRPDQQQQAQHTQQHRGMKAHPQVRHGLALLNVAGLGQDADAGLHTGGDGAHTFEDARGAGEQAHHRGGV